MAQFFTKKHYDAFIPPKPDTDKNTGYGAVVRAERECVKDRFLDLEKPLTKFIKDKGWDLHRHHQIQHLTSSTHFVWIHKKTGETSVEDLGIDWQPIVKQINWLWLHYGKSKDQLNFLKTLLGTYQYNKRDDSDYFNAFYVHARIQFYLTESYFGVYLLFTDKDRYDKSEFLKRLLIQSEEDKYWNLLKPLLGRGFSYVVVIDGEDTELKLTKKLDRTDLFKFIRKSHVEGYSGIRKCYDPDAPEISTTSIVEEMETNLVLLYPLYDFMAYRRGIQMVDKSPGIDLSQLFGGNARVK
jgi:hypothetical protein